MAEFKLQCTANGSWIGFVPDCVPRVCPWPDRMKNARIFLRKQDNITIEIPMEKEMSESIDRMIRDNEERISSEMFISGAEIVIVCDLGYELIGDRIRMCTNETWSSTFSFCAPRNCSIEDHPLFKIFKKLENENDVISQRISFEFDNEKWYSMNNVTATYKQFEIFMEGKTYGQHIILACQNNTRMNLNKLIINEIVSNITWTCNEIGIWIVSNLLLKESELEELLNDSTYVCDRSCTPPEVIRTQFLETLMNNIIKY